MHRLAQLHRKALVSTHSDPGPSHVADVGIQSSGVEVSGFVPHGLRSCSQHVSHGPHRHNHVTTSPSQPQR